jgi:hypothetical protein
MAARPGRLAEPTGSVSLRQKLKMEKNSFEVHHSATLYACGIELMERALTLPGPSRQQVMPRNRLLIACWSRPYRAEASFQQRGSASRSGSTA